MKKKCCSAIYVIGGKHIGLYACICVIWAMAGWMGGVLKLWASLPDDLSGFNQWGAQFLECPWVFPSSNNYLPYHSTGGNQVVWWCWDHTPPVHRDKKKSHVLTMIWEQISYSRYLVDLLISHSGLKKKSVIIVALPITTVIKINISCCSSSGYYATQHSKQKTWKT